MSRVLAVFRTLRGRLVLLVCFATLPALLFTFYVANAERTSVLRRKEQEALLLAQLASREHASQIEGARTMLRELARLLDAAPAPRAGACPGFLPPLLTGFPQFTTIGILSIKGELVCSAHPAPRALSFADNLAFQRALRSQDVEAGDYSLGPVVDRPVLHLAYAVRNAAGNPRLVVFVGIDLRWLDRLTRQAGLPPGYALLIVDRHGRILGRSGNVESLPVGAAGDPRLAALVAGAETTSLDVPGLGRRFLVSAPLRGIPGVSVVAAVPYEPMHAEARGAFFRTVVGLALLTLFTIACALFAAEISVLRVLRQLSRTASRFGAGDLSARADVPSGRGELSDLTRAFNTMADALAARQREATEVQEQLRAMSHRLAAARETEAGRIARELHDELGQVLTSVKIDLATLQRAQLRMSGAGPASEALGASISELNQRLDDAVGFVRRVSSDLRPPVLDRLGLGAALEGLVRDVEGRTRLAIVLDMGRLREPIDWLASITIFRVVQEALTNVVRHAGAAEVSIDLREDSEGDYLLTIDDDGKGIGAAATGDERALGIRGMRERCLLVGGTFEIRGQPGRGTTIVVRIPHGGALEPDAAHAAR